MEFETLKDRVIHILEQAMAALHPVSSPPPVLIEYARDEKFGDYACTIAMDRSWRDLYSEIEPSYKNPKKFAEAICNELNSNSYAKEWIEKAEVAGPGFINLTLTPNALFDSLLGAEKKGNHYGKTSARNPEKIIFEFVSANPTGPLNVVSARAAALGDSCCNLLEAAGHRVHREYYVNDYGNQVRLLGISCLYRYYEWKGASLNFAMKENDGTFQYPEKEGLLFPSEGYHGEYLTDVVQRIIQNHPEIEPDPDTTENAVQLSKKRHQFDSYDDQKILLHSDQFGKAATEHFLSLQKKDLERFRVPFDEFFSERNLHESGQVLSVAKDLSKQTYVEDGKTFFRSTDYGDDKDRVIIREDGRPTYLLADIAYHKTKLERGFDRIYNIWGPDHHGYIKRLDGAMQALRARPDQFRVLIAQQVNLLDEGKPVLMSKRTGRFITMETLLEEIPLDVSRYFFVMRSFESHLDFDFTEAKDTSEKNPYYYVAYAHARIKSILDRAVQEQVSKIISSDLKDLLPHFEMTAERRRLFWLVARFPEEVRDAASSLEPHRLINYLYMLASALSKFYAPKENKIISADKETAAFLLVLLESTALCIKNGLGLLGMEAPDRLTRSDAST